MLRAQLAACSHSVRAVCWRGAHGMLASPLISIVTLSRKFPYFYLTGSVCLWSIVDGPPARTFNEDSVLRHQGSALCCLARPTWCLPESHRSDRCTNMTGTPIFIKSCIGSVQLLVNREDSRHAASFPENTIGNGKPSSTLRNCLTKFISGNSFLLSCFGCRRSPFTTMSK